MKTPRDGINQTFSLKDSRQLGFAEFGAPTGRPVFHFHGSASSRLERPSSEDLLDRMDIRFIAVDRQDTVCQISNQAVA